MLRVTFNFMPIVIQIERAVLLPVIPSLAILSCLVIPLSHERQRSKRRCLGLQQRLTIGPWHLHVRRLDGYVVFLFDNRELYILSPTLSSMNAPNTSRLIVLLLVLLPQLIFELMHNLRIFSPKHLEKPNFLCYYPSWVLGTFTLPLESIRHMRSPYVFWV